MKIDKSLAREAFAAGRKFGELFYKMQSALEKQLPPNIRLTWYECTELTLATPSFLVEFLGSPRDDLGDECQPMTNPTLAEMLAVEEVGPVRVQMLYILSRYAGEVCVCDIESQFKLSQPTISHHLGVLRKAGLLESEQRGLWVFYYVRPAALEQLRGWLEAIS